LIDPKEEDGFVTSERSLPSAVPELPEFWSRIINDNAFSAKRRQFALEMLISRHVRPGLSLGEIAQIFKGQVWIKRKWVGVVGAYSSAVPEFWLRNAPLYIRIFSHEGPLLWLVFQRKAEITTESVFKAFQGEVDPERHPSRVYRASPELFGNRSIVT
jgi:hypothetical protein